MEDIVHTWNYYVVDLWFNSQRPHGYKNISCDSMFPAPCQTILFTQFNRFGTEFAMYVDPLNLALVVASRYVDHAPTYWLLHFIVHNMWQRSSFVIAMFRYLHGSPSWHLHTKWCMHQATYVQATYGPMHAWSLVHAPRSMIYQLAGYEHAWLLSYANVSGSSLGLDT